MNYHRLIWSMFILKMDSQIIFFCCAPSVFLFISDVWQSYGTLCWFVKCQNNLLQLVTETATRGVLSRKVFLKLCKIHRKTSVKKRDSGTGVLLWILRNFLEQFFFFQKYLSWYFLHYWSLHWCHPKISIFKFTALIILWCYLCYGEKLICH